MIARCWRDGLVASVDPAGPLAVISIARFAVTVYGQGIVGVAAAPEGDAVPQELAGLAKDMLAAT